MTIVLQQLMVYFYNIIYVSTLLALCTTSNECIKVIEKSNTTDRPLYNCTRRINVLVLVSLGILSSYLEYSSGYVPSSLLQLARVVVVEQQVIIFILLQLSTLSQSYQLLASQSSSSYLELASSRVESRVVVVIYNVYGILYALSIRENYSSQSSSRVQQQSKLLQYESIDVKNKQQQQLTVVLLKLKV